MNREEWLAHMAQAIRQDRGLIWANTYVNREVRFLPSFPARATRSVTLGDFARQTDGTRLALVSPLISSSLEVAVVVYWLIVRSDYGMVEARKLATRSGVDTMTMAGFNTPFKSCVPTERTIDLLDAVVRRVVDTHGEYPADDVNLAARDVQTTRLLKVSCSTPHYGYGLRNDEYHLRMSALVFNAASPRCGICTLPMAVAHA